MHMKGADHPVIVMKSLQWRWSEGDESVRRKIQPTRILGGANFFQRRLETERFQENG